MRWVVPLLFLLLVTPTLAQDVPQWTDKYVNDFAGVFTQGQASDLRDLLYSLDMNTTAEATVLTINTVSPYDMSQYAQEVFDKWQIGKADKDNGLLILYAKQEDRIWVSTGYGLEGILPDSKIGRILDETFVPARAENNSAEGVILAAQQYAAVIEENADEVRSGQAGSGGSYAFSVWILLMVIFLMVAPLLANYKMAHPKCFCGGKSDTIKTENIKEAKEGPFGTTVYCYYTVFTYKCRKCGKVFTKKKTGQYRRSGFFIVGAGGSGGGFGGGLGGGGGGGGGAGR